MGAATMKSDGERMRSAVTALQHAQNRLVPMADDPLASKASPIVFKSSGPNELGVRWRSSRGHRGFSVSQRGQALWAAVHNMQI
jgi:hypothetical protein